MLIKKLLIIIAVVAGDTAAANASDWWFIGNGGNKPYRHIIFADTASAVRPTSNIVRGWSSTYYENVEPASPKLRYDKVLSEYDCVNRTYKLLSFADYDASGNIVRSLEYGPYGSKTNSVIPDTIGETKLDFFCAGDRTNAVQITDNFSPLESGKMLTKILDDIKE